MFFEWGINLRKVMQMLFEGLNCYLLVKYFRTVLFKA